MRGAEREGRKKRGKKGRENNVMVLVENPVGTKKPHRTDIRKKTIAYGQLLLPGNGCCVETRIAPGWHGS